MTDHANKSKLEKFLYNHIIKKGQPFTHTRISNPSLGVKWGGAYFISDDDCKKFYELYYEHVFKNENQEYLTEKQPENGPLLIDIDFRYNENIEEKQHSEEDVNNLIELILDLFNKIYSLNQQIIKIYIFEKENVNNYTEDDIVKDGIHIMTNVSMDITAKRLFRNMLLEKIPQIWGHLPIINTWDQVLDEGVIIGSATNWQLIGSQKPGHERYELINRYEFTFNNDGDFDHKHITKNYDYKNNLYNLSCRTMETIKFDFNPSIKSQYDIIYNQKKNKSFSQKMKKKRSIKSIEHIENIDDLDILIDNMLEEDNTEINDIHNYTMCLPESYYESGSYAKWIRVGWALKNTDEKLFITWVKFSSQSSDFDFTDIESLQEQWDNFQQDNEDGLTSKSIIYWAKMENPEKYNEIYNNSIDYEIENTFYNHEDYDIANLCYKMYKDLYICASIKDNIWFYYDGNRWQKEDSGNGLRLSLSNDIYKMYNKKIKELRKKINSLKSSESLIKNIADQSNEIINEKNKKNKSDNPAMDMISKKILIFTEIGKKLKSTASKNNIMKEAKDLFYDKYFINNMDKNKYYLCCNNVIIDFKTNTIRPGKPTDYITKSTNINYITDHELNNKSVNQKYNRIKEEIHDFMEKLFPNPNLRRYMWEHLASVLIGTNENQTFTIYNGSGANGKSKLVELMTYMLGEYKGTIPISLVTQKRNGIGGTSSEVANLIGVRYAVMQEPSKGDHLNEGIMKEITGGDPIQCRQLFRESQVFYPQFTVVVCTNTLFEINSQDDGTWRRLRLAEFSSKFTYNPNTIDNPNNNDRYPLDNYPYQYEIDVDLDDKFGDWAPVFLRELVLLCMKTKGKVNDCQEVLNKTDEYRKDKDVLNEFASENIIREDDSNITKTNLKETFKNWYEDKYDKKGMPTGKELYDWMDQRYGKCKKIVGWKGVSLISNIQVE